MGILKQPESHDRLTLRDLLPELDEEGVAIVS